jgi:hypothetical protein
MSGDLALIFQPRAEYEAQARSTDAHTGFALVRRVLMMLTVIGTSLVLAATGTVSVFSVVPMILWWSFVSAIVLASAWLLVLSARRRSLPATRAANLLLAGYTPWLLWLLLISAVYTSAWGGLLGLKVLAVAALFVMIWRARLLFHFCRIILHDTVRGALLRVALHQAVVWFIFFAYACWAIGFEGRY